METVAGNRWIHTETGHDPDESVATIKADPLFKLVEQKRALRSSAWMKHIGYTRAKSVKPEPLGTAEADAVKLQEKLGGAGIEGLQAQQGTCLNGVRVS